MGGGQRGARLGRGAAWLRRDAEACVGARAPKQRRTAGCHSVRATVRARRPGTVSGQATAPARQWAASAGQPRGECLGASGGGARSARGTITATAGPQGRHAGPRASASPRGVRRPAPAGCPSCASGSPPNPRVGPLLRRASRGTPPGCQRVAPSQTAWAGSGSSGAAHATVVPGKATPQSWSACKRPAPDR